MSRTLSYPLRINPRGGAKTELRNIVTLITLGVLPTGDNSPWDERDGLTVPNHVWESDGPELDAAVQAHVEAEFVVLAREGRARLESVTRAAPQSTAEARFVIEWIDLETGASDSTILPSATGGAG